MKEINIAAAIDKLLIFDDPEYCNKIGFGECPKLDLVDEECTQFDYITLSCNNNYEYFKCDQCKTAYLKSKGIEMTGCVLELGEYDNPVECVIDDPDCTQLDCIYSMNGETKESCGFWKTIFVKQR